MDEEDIKHELEKISEQRGLPFETLQERYNEKVKLMKEDKPYPEFDAVDATLQWLRAEDNQGKRVGGNLEELPILTLGMNPGQIYGNPGVKAYGIVNPEDGGLINEEPASDPPGLAVFLCTGTGDSDMDLPRVRELFSEPRLNLLRGWFTRSRPDVVQWKGQGSDGALPTYICYSTEESKFETVEEGEGFGLPSDLQKKRSLINKTFITEEDSFELSTVADNMSTRDEDYPTWPADHGLDIKRFRGWVNEIALSEDNDRGRYKIHDGTLVDREAYEEHSVSVGPPNSRIGMTIYLPGEFVSYGLGSFIEVYGTVTMSGQEEILMNGICTLPIQTEPVNEDDVNVLGGNQQDDDEDDENIRSGKIEVDS